jgi:hypothetical protein
MTSPIMAGDSLATIATAVGGSLVVVVVVGGAIAVAVRWLRAHVTPKPKEAQMPTGRNIV